jgi:hypothetical protein
VFVLHYDDTSILSFVNQAGRRGDLLSYCVYVDCILLGMTFQQKPTTASISFHALASIAVDVEPNKSSFDNDRGSQILFFDDAVAIMIIHGRLDWGNL